MNNQSHFIAPAQSQAKPRQQRTASQMFPLIEAQQGSGLNQKQFCLERGLAPHIFNYWLAKYRAENTEATGFLPLDLKKRNLAANSGQAEHSICLMLGNGLTLNFNELPPVGYLTALVRELS